MPASTRDEAIAIIEKSGLAPYKDLIIPHLKPSIKLHIGDEEVRTPSYFGGIPLLPQGFEWPHWDGTTFAEEGRRDTLERRRAWYPDSEDNRTSFDSLIRHPLCPLSFIAQIYLPDLPHSPDHPKFPRQGMLYFFREACYGPSFWDPFSRGSVQVIHIPDADLQNLTLTPPPGRLRRLQPKGENYLNQRGMSFSNRWHLPPRIDSLPQEAREKYTWLCCNEFGQTGASHLFGNTFLTDAPGRLWDTSRKFNPPPSGVEQDDWQVLLQLRDKSDLDFLAGNTDVFTITIRTRDLAEGNFSNIWFDF